MRSYSLGSDADCRRSSRAGRENLFENKLFGECRWGVGYGVFKEWGVGNVFNYISFVKSSHNEYYVFSNTYTPFLKFPTKFFN